MACSIPDGALLQVYAETPANYTDCFCCDVPGQVTLQDFIEAFYTTWLFRMERAVLTVPLRRRVTDQEVRALALGADRFAVWTREDWSEHEILLCDLSGATRSYLAVNPKPEGTQLIFGSAVVAREGKGLGAFVKALIPLHRFYSRALLSLAARRLRRG